MAAPQKVEATAMQMPLGEPAMLPSQIDSRTPSVSMTRDSTSNPVGTCICRAACVSSLPLEAAASPADK